jgi:hypothetical protein
VPSHELLNAGTASETIVFRPGLAFLALYVFLAVILLLPPAAIGAALLAREPNSGHPGASILSETRPLIRRLYAFMAVIGVAFSAAIAGYTYEAGRTEIRLSRRSLVYAAGRQTMTMPLMEVVTMVFHWQPRAQQIDIGGRRASLTIQIDTLPAPDQALLVRSLSGFAGLTQLRGTDQSSGVIVWKRLGRSYQQEQN